jgi:hypothetical protein
MEREKIEILSDAIKEYSAIMSLMNFAAGST